MGVMRRNLFLVLALFTALCISARADITLEQQTSPEYLINNGYSEAAAEQALMQKNRVAGEPCEPLYEQKHNKFVRFMKGCYSYIDPAQDNIERYHHDIKMSPSHTDL